MVLPTCHLCDCELRQGVYLLRLRLRGIHQLHRCCSTKSSREISKATPQAEYAVDHVKFGTRDHVNSEAYCSMIDSLASHSIEQSLGSLLAAQKLHVAAVWLRIITQQVCQANSTDWHS